MKRRRWREKYFDTIISRQIATRPLSSLSHSDTECKYQKKPNHVSAPRLRYNWKWITKVLISAFESSWKDVPVVRKSDVSIIDPEKNTARLPSQQREAGQRRQLYYEPADENLWQLDPMKWTLSKNQETAISVFQVSGFHRLSQQKDEDGETRSQQWNVFRLELSSCSVPLRNGLCR